MVKANPVDGQNDAGEHTTVSVCMTSTGGHEPHAEQTGLRAHEARDVGTQPADSAVPSESCSLGAAGVAGIPTGPSVDQLAPHHVEAAIVDDVAERRAQRVWRDAQAERRD
jgi:hypothetical protein